MRPARHRIEQTPMRYGNQPVRFAAAASGRTLQIAHFKSRAMSALSAIHPSVWLGFANAAYWDAQP